MTVLVLSRDVDSQVDRLVKELISRNVDIFRTDLAAFPHLLAMTATLGEDGWSGSLSNSHRSVSLRDIRSIWYQHPSHFGISDRMSRPERRHAAAEARVGVAGVLSSLDARWVNHPGREAAMFKPRQLDVARRCGLRVLPTLVTNREESVISFKNDVGDVPLAGKNLTGAALVESGRIRTAYTRRLGPSDLSDLRGVNTTAHLFQEFVDNKAFEVRATCVGDRIFAAAIHANSKAAQIDFRADYPALTYAEINPPPGVREGMRAFMKSFDITFGAFDFAVTESGEWVFFECNPFGAYGWLEDALGLDITSAVADVLTDSETL